MCSKYNKYNIQLTFRTCLKNQLLLLWGSLLEPFGYLFPSFGGAGPTHACLLAEEVGIKQILVPRSPGTMCALGATIADYQYNFIRSLRRPLAELDSGVLREVYRQLEQEGRNSLASESPIIERVEVLRSANMRYRGQSFDVDVTLRRRPSI